MKNFDLDLLLLAILAIITTIKAQKNSETYKHSRILYHISPNQSIQVIDNQSHLYFTSSHTDLHKSLKSTVFKNFLSSDLNKPNIYSLLHFTDTCMLIGTYERLLNISFNDLKVNTEQNQITWSTRRSETNECDSTKLKNLDDKIMYMCSNYIRGVVVLNQRLVVCGTNGSVPYCRGYSEGKLNDEFQQPQLNSLKRVTDNNYLDVDETAPFIHQDSLYFVNSGSYTLEPTINKLVDWGLSDLESFGKLVKTPKGALKNAKFRASFASGDKLYFFFCETDSVTDYRSGLTFKTQHSLIGEVCANDIGKHSYLESFNRFITFKKADIYCYLPDTRNGFHVKYTEIQAVSSPVQLNGNEPNFYAIFIFRRMDSIDSALCQFRMTTVDETMNGYFKSTDNDDRITYKQPLATCHAYKHLSDADLNKYYQERSQNYNYQMETTVNEPVLFAMNGARFTAIAIDQPGKRNNFNEVIFIGLADGRVLKLLTKPVYANKRIYQQPIVVQEYQMLEHNQTINSLIVTKQGQLIAVSNEIIRSVDLDVACFVDYNTCSSCLKTQDPYCSWSTTQAKCVSLKHDQQEGLVKDSRKCLKLDGDFTLRTLKSDNQNEYGTFGDILRLTNFDNKAGNLLIAIFLTAVLTFFVSVGLTLFVIKKRSKMSEYLSRHLSTTLSSSTASYINNGSSSKSAEQNFYLSIKPLTAVDYCVAKSQDQHSPNSDLLLSSGSSIRPTNDDTLSSSNESCCFRSDERVCGRYIN